MRAATALACLCVLVGGGVGFAGRVPDPLPVAAEDRDAGNPRNVRWAWPVIEWVGIEPRAEVRAIGDGPRRPETERAAVVIAVRNAGEERAEGLEIRGLGEGAVGVPALGPGERAEVRVELATDALPYGGTLTLASAGGEAFDAFRVHGEDAHRVAVVVDAGSWADGDERFGSLARRLRKSFEDLHEVFDGRGVPGTAEGGGHPDRERIPDRFRLEHVELFDPEAGTPGLFLEHPEFDLVLAVNEGGPLCCFWLTDDPGKHYSIGHNFTSKGADGAVRGIWSLWGEHALWHELLHYRGVPDYYMYKIAPGSLPGRTPEGWSGWGPGDDARTAAYGADVMNSPYRAIEVGRLTAAVAASKAGVSRIGPCEDPTIEYGHMWRWLPERVEVRVVDGEGRTMEGEVRWYRPRPAGLRDARQQGVAEGAEPLGRSSGGAMALELTGDYMNASGRRSERALWLLVEAERAGEGGTERRWGILTGLELNEAWVDGARDRYEAVFAWEEMRAAEDGAE